MCQKYNGWEDHSTWCLSMMVDGNYEQGDYHYWLGEVQRLGEDSADADEHARQLADALSEWFDEAVDSLNMPAFFRDMLNTPNFYEVAENMVSGWREEGNRYAGEEEEEEEEETN